MTMERHEVAKNTAKIRPRMDAFRDKLPHFTELHNRFTDNNPENFFRDFPFRLQGSEVTQLFYQSIDKALGFIPAASQEAFADKVKSAAMYRDVKSRRHWEKLHDVFNEAFGGQLLVEKLGCSSIELLEPGSVVSPDWRGKVASRVHYLEVKTINHSDDERKSWYDQRIAMPHQTRLSEPLITKLTKAYQEAVTQVSQPADSASAGKAVLLIINPDHNLDPFDQPVAAIFQKFLDTIEQPAVRIYYQVNS